MDEAGDRDARSSRPVVEDRGEVRTVEEEVRDSLMEMLGGVRGSIEMALPILVFTIAYVVREDLRAALVAGGVAAVASLAVRLAVRSDTRFARNGLVGMAFAAAFALAMGRGEAAFLPHIIQSGAWALALGISVVVRWPLAGFLVGAILGETTAWRDNPAIVALSNRLTLILLVPMVLRVGVQLPLYLAGEVAWLGVARLGLGWPLTAAAAAVAGLVLVRGETPLPATDAARAS